MTVWFLYVVIRSQIRNTSLLTLATRRIFALDFVERYLSRMLTHYCMVPLLFANKYKAALVTGQEAPAGSPFPWLPDDMPEGEPFLSALE